MAKLEAIKGIVQCPKYGKPYTFSGTSRKASYEVERARKMSDYHNGKKDDCVTCGCPHFGGRFGEYIICRYTPERDAIVKGELKHYDLVDWVRAPRTVIG